MHLTRPSLTSRLDGIAGTPLLVFFQLPQELGETFGHRLLDELRIEYLELRPDLALDRAIGRSIPKICWRSVDVLLVRHLRTVLRPSSWQQPRRFKHAIVRKYSRV